MKTTVEEMDRIRRDFFSDLNERGTTSMYPANQTSAPRASNGGAGSQLAAATMLPLDELSKAIHTAQDRIANCASTVRSVADNLFGAEPEGSNSGQAQPSRAGRFGSLNDQSDVLHAQIFELERQLGRLHPISQ